MRLKEKRQCIAKHFKCSYSNTNFDHGKLLYHKKYNISFNSASLLKLLAQSDKKQKRSLQQFACEVINRRKLGKSVDIRLITSEIFFLCVWRHKSCSVEREIPKNIFQVKFNEVKKIEVLCCSQRKAARERKNNNTAHLQRKVLAQELITHASKYFCFVQVILQSTDRRPRHLAGF